VSVVYVVQARQKHEKNAPGRDKYRDAKAKPRERKDGSREVNGKRGENVDKGADTRNVCRCDVNNQEQTQKKEQQKITKHRHQQQEKELEI